ncbi:MAG: RidA family protein [Sulfitobacter sp.]
MAQSFNPPNIWKPFGAFSQAVAAGSGQTLYLKGQVALDPEDNVVGEGDMNTQVSQVLENVAAILAAAGGRMSDIVSIQQFTTDIQAFMQCGDIRATYFNAPFPVTTTLEVSSLYDPRLLIEITCIAEIPFDRFACPKDAVEMHREP